MKSVNWSAAISQYRKVLEKSPRDAFGLYNLALPVG